MKASSGHYGGKKVKPSGNVFFSGNEFSQNPTIQLRNLCAIQVPF